MNIPEGWKLVPVEPTPAMTAAYSVAAEEVTKRHLLSGSYPATWQPIEAGYAAMLAAAPATPAQPVSNADELERLRAELAAAEAFHKVVVSERNYERVVSMRLQAELAEALEALRALLDEQDGPPLIRRAQQWQAAVDAARALLIKRGAA